MHYLSFAIFAKNVAATKNVLRNCQLEREGYPPLYQSLEILSELCC